MPAVIVEGGLARYAVAGLAARMIPECMPGAALRVKVTDASANPAAASPSRYSARDGAPAMQPACAAGGGAPGGREVVPGVAALVPVKSRGWPAGQL